MIHTYSLIHDDLPAMDNDDFRRGKPSNHKAFGEANAILAGDGLLNTAYEICFAECKKGEKQVRAAQILSEGAGVYGVIAGQAADLASENGQSLTQKDLVYIHEHKTGKLLLAPVAMACVLSGDKYYFQLEKFAKALGVLFQITDDILDVVGEFEKMGKSIGKDEKEDKLTYVKLYGLEGANARADLLVGDCNAFLEGVDGDIAFLRDFAYYVRNRKN
ncbi:MAG: polyprenyl synthetase family protein [Clostridia bacterium]|nr:polyprenyl synthetase family protein [Clostridia bacterium]